MQVAGRRFFLAVQLGQGGRFERLLDFVGVGYNVRVDWFLGLLPEQIRLFGFLGARRTEEGLFLELQSVVPALILVHSGIIVGVHNVALVPLAVELLLYKFDNALLLVLDAGLLLAEAVELSLAVCNLLAVAVHVHCPGERVFVPDVQDRHHDAAAQVVEGLRRVELPLSLVVLVLLIVEFVPDEAQNFPVVALLKPHLLEVGLQLAFLLKELLAAVVNFLRLFVEAVLDEIASAGIFFGEEGVVVGVEMVAALESV